MLSGIEVTLTNETEGHSFAHFAEPLSDLYLGSETPSMGDIYRAMQSEYGVCRSKVYRDTDNGPRPVGWYFQSRQHYEDTGEPYLRGAWVVVGEYVPAREAHVR